MTTQPALQVPADALTRKLLRKAVGGSNSLYSFLELLCVDDIYVFKDDFDEKLNDLVWATYRDPEPESDPDLPDLTGGRSFEVINGLSNGFLIGDPGRGDGSNIRLVGRKRKWTPSRRPVVMGRFRLETLSNIALEFGFADVDASRVGDADAAGILTSLTTPTARAGRSDFAVAGYNSTDGFYGVVHSRPQTSSVAATGPSSPSAQVEFSVLVATNEMNECRVWLNGAIAAQVRNSTPTGRYVATPLAIWLYMENTAESSLGDRLRVDYITAWQERAALV